MSVSKAQKERVTVVCKCGCGKVFSAFPVYRPRSEGGGLRVPEYYRGHHPSCRSNQTGAVPAWNKGINKEEYPGDSFPSGENHGNWKGGHRGDKDTARWHKLRAEIQLRDNYTCQECGDRNRQGRGSRISLEVHHIKPVCEHPELFFEPENLILLCKTCHIKTHSFGGKALRNKRGAHHRGI